MAFNSLTVVNPDAVMIQNTVMEMDFALYSVWVSMIH